MPVTSQRVLPCALDAHVGHRWVPPQRRGRLAAARAMGWRNVTR
jgi:hypothetical protein